ncbi:hypothetical protein ACWDYH_31225 [Nocardia goodfellowii]
MTDPEQSEPLPGNRIQLEPSDGGVPGREVIVGWDRGLGTYFAQVIEGVDEWGEDFLRLHIGVRPDEVHDPEQVIEAVRPYAKIPDSLIEVLTAQHDAPGALERSPFIDLAMAINDGRGPDSAQDLLAMYDLDPSAAVHTDAELDSREWSGPDSAGPPDATPTSPEQGYEL